MKKYLDILKKYWLSFCCGVVAILAVLATWFWPLPGMVIALQSKVDERKAVYNNVEQIRNASRPMPVIDISDPAAAELDVFPSQAVIEAGDKATSEVNVEALKMLDVAVRMNASTHLPLLDQSLPDPTGPVRFQFRDIYLDAMEQDPAKRPGRPLRFKDEILRAIFPPSQAELDAAKSAVTTKYEQALAGSTASPADIENNKALMERELSSLSDMLRARRSREGIVYLSPDALSVNPNIRGNAAPVAEAIWSAQLMVWIQEDFCRAVASTNTTVLSVLPAEARRDVTNSPIKHLIRLTVAPDPRLAIGEPHNDPTTPLPEQPAVTLSKRVSNGLYETYRFNVTMNVETAKIPTILIELSRNQFLTIIKADATGIDSLAALQQGYVYGTQPVSTLQLEVELLYMRKWIEPFMPPLVKARLTQAGSGAPAGGPGLQYGGPRSPDGE